MKSIIIGSAGHVDHGKTTLIKNLTGTDTDRLIEEKKRGLTIDLGYAFLTENIAFIDVPGHERFIKNMVAGATTINFVMLIIAADDGIMPQTVEHFAILKLLNIEHGIIVITKTDIVHENKVDDLKLEIKEFIQDSFLANSNIFEVTKKNDSKMKILRSFLLDLPKKNISIADIKPFRMPIDRVFTAKGFGTIVTGTVISGKLKQGVDNLAIYPEKIPVKIRSIESQNQKVVEISKNHRCAINIQSIDYKLLHRGQLGAEKKCFKPTKIITCSLTKCSYASEIKYGEEVKFHINTLEIKARIRIIGQNTILNTEQTIVQFDFPNLICVGFKDRFIVRKLSPNITIGGGMILDVNSTKIKKNNIHLIEKFQIITKSKLKQNIINILEIFQFINIEKLSVKLSEYQKTLQPLINELINENQVISTGKYLYGV